MRQPRSDLARTIRSRLAQHLGRAPSLGVAKVTTYFDDPHTPIETLVAEEELAIFLKADLQLHGPEPMEHAQPAVAITVASLRAADAPYWWSTPGLGDNGDPKGATVLHWSAIPTLVWQRAGSDLPKALQHYGYDKSPLPA